MTSRTRQRTPDGTVSIARALSKLGLCSRADGERLVTAGRVTVDGIVVRDLAFRVQPETARIAIDAEHVTAPDRVYIALNKPRGLVTTRADPAGRATVYDCLTDPALPFVAPIGRLDKASEGLLLLTNDSQWSARLLDPASHVDKTYHVQVRAVLDDAQVSRLAADVVDPETSEVLRVKHVRLLRVGSRSTSWLEIVLDEGRNRHIRRWLDAFHIEVLRLVRVAIGPLALGTLTKGAWRVLTATEVNALTPARPSRDHARR